MANGNGNGHGNGHSSTLVLTPSPFDSAQDDREAVERSKDARSGQIPDVVEEIIQSVAR